MKIQVGGLSEGVFHYQFRAAPMELGLGAHFSQEVAVQATIEKTRNQMHLRAMVQTTGVFECDRCITDFRKEMSPSYEMHYVTGEEESGRFDPTEVQVLSPGYTVIDIREDVRQTLLLAVPLKLLCREECAGMCPQCAKNLNDGPCGCSTGEADTRWEQLRKLRSS